MDNHNKRPYWGYLLVLLMVFAGMVYLLIRYPLIILITLIAIISVVTGSVMLKDRRKVEDFYRNLASSSLISHDHCLQSTLTRARSGIIKFWKLKGYNLKAVSKAVLVFKDNNRYRAEFILLARFRHEGTWIYLPYTFQCSQLLSGKLYAIVNGQANEKDLPPIDLVVTNPREVFMLRSENPNR